MEKLQSKSLISRAGLISRIRRSRVARRQFVDSYLGKSIAYQLRATRDRLNWSQAELADKVGMNQNAISRLESPDYGKPTITTLKRLASAMDVGLIVHFVPLSQIIDWVSGTPRVDRGLSTRSLAVANFEEEEKEGVFDRQQQRIFVVEPRDRFEKLNELTTPAGKVVAENSTVPPKTITGPEQHTDLDAVARKFPQSQTSDSYHQMTK